MAGAAKRAARRTLAEILAARKSGALRPAEETLREACRTGEHCIIASKRPEEATADNTVGADFVRFLALGGDEYTPVHEKGVQLVGAWIEGAIDLECATLPHRLMLARCRIEQLTIMDATLPGLYLDGSSIERGIEGDRVNVAGGVYLRNGFRAQGEVGLLGAEIGGDLDCTGGAFENASGYALSCGGAKVTGRFFFRDVRALAGQVSLSSVHVGTFVDDALSWAGGKGELVLDGFSYGRIGGNPAFDGNPAFVSAAERIAWLKSQRPQDLRQDFCPQPWEQLIAVLRAMGHPNDARKIAIAKQDQLRAAGRMKGIRKPAHWLYGKLARYGYSPERLLGFATAVWLGFALLFWWGSTDDVWPVSTGPTLYLNAPEPKATPHHPPLHRFDPWRYSLDALLPIDLGYTSSAHPDEERFWGAVLGWAATVETMLGWLAGVVLIASATSLLKKD